MNANAVARNYGALTAEERFRLIVAAGARGDAVEQDRLAATSRRLTQAVPDHAPFGQAFYEVSLFTYLDLSETAAKYLDALHRAHEAEIFDDDESEDELEDAEPEDADPAANAGERAVADEDQTPAERLFDLALAEGYRLQVKGEGWKSWCKGMDLPPFAAWEALPGFARLQRALRLASRTAFTPEGMLRWLNALAPAGQPALAELPTALTAEAYAAASEEMFRHRVEWWGR
jgi:hypothetical protein